MKWLSLKLLAMTALLAVVGSFGYVAADSIVRSFNGKGDIKPGQIVALVTSAKNTVEPAPANDPTDVYGVAVDQSETPVTLEQNGQNIFVATNGVYPVFVSNENGPIVSGDYLSLSSADGIAAKDRGKAIVVGRATQSFDGQSGVVGNGKDGSVIGKILAQVSPGANPLLRQDNSIPAPLRRLGESIAGKPLSASRVYSALAIFIITVAVAFILLWVGVRNGMIAIGRNPLSRHFIIQNLAQVIMASVIVFAIGLLGIYLLLRI